MQHAESSQAAGNRPKIRSRQQPSTSADEAEAANAAEISQLDLPGVHSASGAQSAGHDIAVESGRELSKEPANPGQLHTQQAPSLMDADQAPVSAGEIWHLASPRGAPSCP